MTRKAAIHEVVCTRQDGPAWSHLVAVRWSTRFGYPNWTVESRTFAESQVAARGAEEMRIEA